jgi:hypothetical protein
MVAPEITLNLDNDVKIEWGEPSSSGTGATIGYTVLFKNLANEYVELDECDGSDPTIFAQRFCTLTMVEIHNLLELPADDLIEARVYAESIYCRGNSSPSNISGVRVVSCPARMSLDTIVREDVTDYTVLLNWDFSVNSEIIEYDVQAKKADGVSLWEDSIIRTTNADEFLFEGLEKNVRYEFRLRAVNAFCPGPTWSITQRATTGEVAERPSSVKTSLVYESTTLEVNDSDAVLCPDVNEGNRVIKLEWCMTEDCQDITEDVTYKV